MVMAIEEKQLTFEDVQTKKPGEVELAFCYDPAKHGKIKPGETLIAYADGSFELMPPGKSKQSPDLNYNDSWSEGGQIYFLDGWAWGVTPDLDTVCLGHAGYIDGLAHTQGGKTGNPVIDKIIKLERSEHERSQTVEIKRPGNFRSRIVRDVKRRVANSRRSPARKRLSRNQTKR